MISIGDETDFTINNVFTEMKKWLSLILIRVVFDLQADIDPTKRAGELSEEEVDKIVTIMQNPRQYKIPDWFLNRQKDIKDGKNAL